MCAFVAGQRHQHDVRQPPGSPLEQRARQQPLRRRHPGHRLRQPRARRQRVARRHHQRGQAGAVDAARLLPHPWPRVGHRIRGQGAGAQPIRLERRLQELPLRHARLRYKTLSTPAYSHTRGFAQLQIEPHKLLKKKSPKVSLS